jgi:hypothetical protein
MQVPTVVAVSVAEEIEQVAVPPEMMEYDTAPLPEPPVVLSVVEPVPAESAITVGVADAARLA